MREKEGRERREEIKRRNKTKETQTKRSTGGAITCHRSLQIMTAVLSHHSVPLKQGEAHRMNPHSLPHPCSRQLSHASEEECSDLSEMCGECVDVCVCGGV